MHTYTIIAILRTLSGRTKNVANVVGATSSEGFIISISNCQKDSRSTDRSVCASYDTVVPNATIIGPVIWTTFLPRPTQLRAGFRGRPSKKLVYGRSNTKVEAGRTTWSTTGDCVLQPARDLILATATKTGKRAEV